MEVLRCLFLSFLFLFKKKDFLQGQVERFGLFITQQIRANSLSPRPRP